MDSNEREQIDAAIEQYSQLWEEAIRSEGSPPDRDEFVSRFATTGKLELLAALRSIDDQFAGRLGQIDVTQEHEPSDSAQTEPHAANPCDHTASMQVGPYRLLEMIGEGGFGEVWAAQQSRPVQRRVAVKIIKRGMDTREIIGRFEAERQALAMMDHPHVAKIYDAGTTHDGRPYFAMELVRGVRITDYCDENRLSISDRIKLFIQVCEAIQHAHQKGIIHRDIKPSNILVTDYETMAVPKVIDFGIAKALHRDLTDKTVYTRLQQFLGTPAYTSPEQLEMTGTDIDTRSDIYSLGVLLYEVLVGKTPFDNQKLLKAGLEAVRDAIRDTDPPRPSMRFGTLDSNEQTTAAKSRRVDPRQLVSELKGDLDWIVLRCLEKDRVRRYSAASEVAADLSRHLNNEVITAAPPSWSYQIGKLMRRHWKSVVVGAATVSLLALAAAFSTWQALRAAHQRNVAVTAQKDAESKEQQAVSAKVAEAELRKRAEDLKRQADLQLQQSRLNLYAADVANAHKALQQNNLGAARRRLYRQAKVSPDLLGFEWRLLWNETRGDHLASIDFGEITNSIVLLDDRMAVVSTNFESVVLCDLVAGQRVRILKESEPTRTVDMHRLVVLPSQHRLMYFGDEILAWDVRDWTPIEFAGLANPTPEGQRYWSASISADESHVAAGHFDGVTIWRANDMTVVGTIPVSSFFYGRMVTFLDEGNRLAIGDRPPDYGVGPYVQVWSFSESPFEAELRWMDDKLDASALKPHGKFLVGASTQGDLVVYDAESGDRISERETHDATFVFDLEIHPHNQSVYSAGGDHVIGHWSLPDLKPLGMLRGHSNEVWALDLRDDDRLVSSGKESVLFWNPRRVARQRSIEGLTDEGIFTPDSKFLIGNHRDKGPTVWSTSSLEPLVSFNENAKVLAVSEQGLVLLATWDRDGLNVSTFDPLTGNRELTHPFAEITREEFEARGNSECYGVDVCHSFESRPTGTMGSESKTASRCIS